MKTEADVIEQGAELTTDKQAHAHMHSSSEQSGVRPDQNESFYTIINYKSWGSSFKDSYRNIYIYFTNQCLTEASVLSR